MEEILLDDKDEDVDASSTNESEDEVVEVGRGKVNPVKRPPGKLAPIFMLGKPPKVQQTKNIDAIFFQCCGSGIFESGSGSSISSEARYTDTDPDAGF
jgi:hypothetical protein